MKQVYGKSDSGSVKEALRGITAPDALIMISNGGQFEQNVKEIQDLFPEVPCIGGTGHFYGDTVKEGGVGVIALTGVKASAGVMRNVSTMPMHDISTFEGNMKKVNAGPNDTVCIDICTGNDACVLTSLYSALGKSGISLIGGTSFDPVVSVNGQIYEDADAYILIKNTGGRVKVYKENIYEPLDDTTFIASRTDRSKYFIGELNGRPAKEVYKEHLNISEADLATQTFQNPFGKMTGRDVCIISIKEPSGSGLCCYRQVNDSDVLRLLDLKDFRGVVANTVDAIRSDFSRVSGIISVNCAFRYILFNNENYMGEYLRTMSSLGCHCGFVGNGEHFNSQFINQTMSCVVFE